MPAQKESKNVSELRTTQEAAQRIRSVPATMERWRSQGTGPRFVKIGGKVFYRDSDLDEWVESRVRWNTAQEAAAR